MASWQFSCVGHGGGRKWGSIADTVKLINPCIKQENEKIIRIYPILKWKLPRIQRCFKFESFKI